MMTVHELKRRNPLLFRTGLFNLVLAVAMGAGLALDPREVLGINVWVKPLKFALSITLFTWTVAWLTEYVKEDRRTVARISRAVAIAMVVEILCIGGQSARGVASHFNVAGPLDGLIFAIMGLMILINTGAVGALLKLFLRGPLNLPAAYARAIQLGLVIFIVGSVEGVLMIANRAHTVGMPDGGPGLPLINWSTRAGDLRVAHFLGLHAIQFLPIFGWVVRRQAAGVTMVTAFACVYLAVTLGLFIQATLGHPILGF